MLTGRSLSKGMMRTVIGGDTLRQTLGEDIHRIVDLNIHMVADCGELLPLGRNNSTVFRLDLIRG